MMHAETIPDLFRQQADRFGPRIALRTKRYGLYHDLRWSEYREQINACALSLIAHGIQPGDRVGILSENRLEWLVADMAILTAGAVNVPLHAPLSAQQVHYQLDNSGTRWLFVSSRAQLDKIEQIRAKLPELKGVIIFDDHAALGSAGASPSHISAWTGFLQRGRSARARLQAELDRREAHLLADDLATIIYTSGTTGNPKGVMLTQRNLASVHLRARFAVLQLAAVQPHLCTHG
jgi:long-chain acyl-CoA synthetase